MLWHIGLKNRTYYQIFVKFCFFACLFVVEKWSRPEKKKVQIRKRDEDDRNNLKKVAIIGHWNLSHHTPVQRHSYQSSNSVSLSLSSPFGLHNVMIKKGWKTSRNTTKKLNCHHQNHVFFTLKWKNKNKHQKPKRKQKIEIGIKNSFFPNGAAITPQKRCYIKKRENIISPPLPIYITLYQENPGRN